MQFFVFGDSMYLTILVSVGEILCVWWFGGGKVSLLVWCVLDVCVFVCGV